MVTKTYGTTSLPSDSVTVLAGSTVDISIAFNAVVGIVGGMDTNNGSASAGTVKEVSSASKAADFFGTDSELHNQVKLAYANNAENVYAVGLSETTVSAESVTQSDTVDNTPVIDPNVNPEHSVSLSDTSGTDPDVTIVYDDSPATPSGSDEANFNPINGKLEVDSTAAGSYEIDYDYVADFQTPIQDVLNEDIRFLVVCTEDETAITTAGTELDAIDDNFDFVRNVSGGIPGQAEADYSDSVDDQRVSIAQAPRGKNTDGNEVRTCGAVGGLLASAPLGESRTGTNHGQLSGLDSIGEHYTSYPGTSDLAKFNNDHQLLTLNDASGIIYVTQDNTTSTDGKFDRVYATEIIDEVVELSHQINESFVGDLNTPTNRQSIEDQHDAFLEEMRTDRPPLLDDYAVNVSDDATNDDEVDVEIGLDVVNVMDTIDVTVTVGDITTASVN